MASFGALAGAAYGDGIFLPSRALGSAGRPSSSAQKAILIREGSEEVLLLQTTYQGPSAAFVWVVPVPAVPADVFEAEPLFLDEVFRNTDPRVVTTISGRTSDGAPPATKAASAGAPAAERSAPAVTVHQRLEVGDYDASVLSATGGQALTTWLRDNGYQVSDEAGAALQPYVEQSFAFVVVRFLSGVAETKPTVTTVAPLGIRFQTEKLFFPLGISRGSAPPLTSILLCVLDDGPVDCETIPTAWVGPKSQRLAKGETYGTVRRRLTRSRGAAQLLCEFSGTEALTHDDLSYRADQWATPSLTTGLPDRHATRFFALLPVEEMEDLWFAPAPDGPRDYVVLIERKGAANADAIRRWQAWAKADVARRAGLPVEWLSAGGSRTERAGSAGEVRARFAGVCLLVVVVVGLVRLWRRGVPPGTLLALLLVCLAVPVVLAGGDSAAIFELDRELGALDEALRGFVTDTGGYPAALGDLAATSAPAEVLDVSGNVLPMKGEWKGPYVHELPPDLMGGELAYDVLNLRTIDAGGWSVTVRSATREDADRARGTMGRGAASRGARGRSTAPLWAQPDGAVRADHVEYARWLAGRSSDTLLVGRVPHTSHSGYDAVENGVQAYTTVVADPRGDGSFTFATNTLWVDARTGRAFTSQVCAHPFYDGRDASLLYGLFATSRDAPLARAVARPLRTGTTHGVLSRDGSRLALWDRDAHDGGAVLVGSPAGPFREVARGHFFEGEFAPDGAALYLLGTLGSGQAKTPKSQTREAVLRRTQAGDKRPGPPGLVRVPLDGSAPEVVYSPLDARFLSLSKHGVLAYRTDGTVLLFPSDGGAPAEMPIPEGRVLCGARAFDDGIVTIVVGTRQEPPPPGSHTGSFLPAEAYVRARPGAAPRRLATIRLFSGAEAGIVGLTSNGSLTLAWHASAEPTAPWVVKAIAADGTARILEHCSAADEDRAGRAARGTSPAWTATEGASLP
jgi:hypothetical protein